MTPFYRLSSFLLLGMLWCSPAHAQGAGCGPQNPNCIVPTAPNGDSSGRAASTSFVQTAISGGGGSPQNANTVHAGPATGVPAAPTFRPLVGADLPAPTASTLGGVQSATAPANQFQTGISTGGAPTFAQPSCGNLSNSAASCSTDATNATNIASGTLGAARLPAGVDANVLNAQTGNYPIANTDCGKTISATGGPWTLTLPAVTGFGTTCVVQVCNADPNDVTHHAIRLSGFPAPSLGRLWMQQCEEVSINNGAWIVTKWPGKWRPGFVPTLYVDTGGSDTNDGLVSNVAANALATVQQCFNLFTREMDLGTGQPTCAPTGGQIQNGGISCAPGNTPAVFNVYGNGGSLAIIRNTGGNVVVQESDFCGYIIFDNVNIDCTSAASHPCTGLFIHQQNGADLSTGGHTVGVTFTGAAASDVAVNCDSMCKINANAAPTLAGTFNSGFNGNLGSMFYWANGVVFAASLSLSGGAFVLNSGSQISYSGPVTYGAASSINETFTLRWMSAACISMGTVTGTASGRQWSVLNNSFLTNTSATAVPGPTVGINTAAGFAAGVIGASTSGAGC